MSAEELFVVRIKDDFYRDGFNRILLALVLIIAAVILLIATSLYLFLSKPPPVYFATDNEFRVLPPAPIMQPYLKAPDLIQWVNEALSSSFTYDYLNYSRELDTNKHFFTDNGWKIYTTMLNNYAAAKTLQTAKVFVNGIPYGAPFIVNQGVLDGRYAWWIQMPLQIRSTGYQANNLQTVTFQVLVVRISTLNDLNGIAIDNIVATSGKSTPTTGVQGGFNG